MRTTKQRIGLAGILLALVSCLDEAPSSEPASADGGDVGLDGGLDLYWDLDVRGGGAASQRALLCDGVDDRVRIDVADLLADPEAVTIELWFRPDRFLEVGSPDVYILNASAGARFHDEFSIGFGDGYERRHRALLFRTRKLEDGACDGARGTGWLEQLEVGRWHHVAATLEHDPYDGRIRQVLYLDGVGKVGNGAPWPTEESMCVAPREVTLCSGFEVDGLFWAPFAGAIDALRISDVVRYHDDFEPAAYGPDADTVLYLDFEQWPPVDSGPHALAVTAEGEPELTSDAEASAF